MNSTAPLTRPETAPVRALHRLPGFLALAVAVVALDQGTKALVRARLEVGEAWPEGWEWIRLTHVQNTGAAFGILQGAGDFLVVAALVAIGAMTFYLLTLPAHSRYFPAALSMVLGGAVGNLVDRVRLGHVTDFIDPIYYWAFNVADSAIVIGIGIMVAVSFLDGHDEPVVEAGAERAG